MKHRIAAAILVMGGLVAANAGIAADANPATPALQQRTTVPGSAPPVVRQQHGRTGGVSGVDDDNIAARVTELEARLAAIEQVVTIGAGKITLLAAGSKIVVSGNGIDIESTKNVTIKSAARVTIKDSVGNH
jgi:hypothetical protein